MEPFKCIIKFTTCKSYDITLFIRLHKKKLKGISNDVAQQTSKLKPHY